MRNLIYILFFASSFMQCQNLETLDRLRAQQNVIPPVQEVLAFPSALGAGANSIGGRGGQVIHVTTLNWDGPGSLKEAIQTTGPRIIVFDVSGEIDATSQGYFEDLINGPLYNNLTIAGQSAPHGGITLKTTHNIFNNVSDVIIRYIRFRVDTQNFNEDALWFLTGQNIIFDHCSFSHGWDEALDISSSTSISSNITIQSCIFADSKTGILLGADTREAATPLDDFGDFSFINNAITNISHRFPNPTGRGHYDIINNVVYNWKERIVRITQDGTYNILNNYYKPSLEGLRREGWFSGNADLTVRLNKLQLQLGETPLIHTKGNIVTGQRETPLNDDSDMWQYFAGSNAAYPEGSPVALQYFTNVQFELAGVPFDIKPANQAYTDVLNDVGANKTLNADGTINHYLDTKDASDILMIQNDGFVSRVDYNFEYPFREDIPFPIIPQNTRLSGFYGINPHIPQAFLSAKGVTNTLTVHNELAPSGYTWLEEYLNQVDQ